MGGRGSNHVMPVHIYMHLVIYSYERVHLPLMITGWSMAAVNAAPQRLFMHAAYCPCRLHFHHEGCAESTDMVLCRQVSFRISQMKH